MIPKDFSLLEFSDYKNISGQYTDDFIKNSLYVKIEEDDEKVLICAVKNKSKDQDILINFHYPKEVEFVYEEESIFAEFVGKYVEQNHILTNESNQKELFSLDSINSDAPIVNIINAICLEALRKSASDIHIQPSGNNVIVRFRIDGVLQIVKELDKSISTSLLARIKVMSNLNIMENRLPQDGRMSVTLNQKRIDFRVSIVPVSNGQSIVLRLFNYKKEVLKLNDLGFSEDLHNILKEALRIPNGIILSTGPTGSGKTTTLHALLEEMDKEHLKIITIEDPVERILENVDQIQVNESIGLTFESILRRVLRQDPDVIMIGEIRDKETAQLAIRAALTGHVILSTLHTNDSISTITRLENLGIESYLIANVLKYSLAQRLVRKKCKHCNGESTGCRFCNYTGYKGRTVVGEILNINSEISKIISKGNCEEKLKDYLKNRNFKTLREDALEKVKNNITTRREIEREALI